MKHKLAIIPILASLMVIPAPSFADGGHNDAGIPQSEYKIAADLGMEGPTETTGIGGSKLLGILPLDSEFEALAGHVMRVREITLLPGGKVAVHQHASRPGVAYVLEGTAVEHRNDSDTPLQRVPGDVSLEKSGTIHWWANESDQPATVLVVDIVEMDA